MTLPGPPPDPTAPNPATAAARVLLDELARCGVAHVVMAPGSRSTALVVAAHDHPRLQLHVEVDERSAGFVAVGIARASGQPAVVVTTSGTAVANLLPAVVEADHDRVPLLLLTADRPPEAHGTGANQTIDQVGIFGDSTRWSVDLGVPGSGPEEVARWRWTACRAHGAAVGRPVDSPAVVGLDAWREPGPVHVNAPFREPTVPATDDGRTRAEPFVHPLEGRPAGQQWASGETHDHVPPDHVVAEVAAALAGVDRGLVVVGGAVDGEVGPVTELAAALQWPVVAEPHARVAGPGVLDHATLLLGAEAFASAHEPELVLRIGRSTVAREVVRLLARTPQYVVDAHGGWGAQDAERTTLVRGAVGATVTALLDALGAEPGAGQDPTWRRAWEAADRTAREVVDRTLELSELSELRVARDLVALVPAGGALVVGSSLPIREVDLVASRRPDLAVHANRGASGIDGFASTALGVALAHTGPTVALCGDLTLLHDSNGWLLSPDPAAGDLDLVVVVLDNDGGGIFSLLPQRQHVAAFERVMGTPHGRDLAHLAALHELALHRPGTPGAAVGAVEDALAAGGRHLVHVRTDREDTRSLLQRLQQEVAGSLAGEG